jgi:hypothetical protein
VGKVRPASPAQREHLQRIARLAARSRWGLSDEARVAELAEIARLRAVVTLRQALVDYLRVNPQGPLHDAAGRLLDLLA